MNRDQAIAWLRAVGRNARARDWNVGETILILFGEPSIDGGYPGAVYLYPSDNGSWGLLDFGLLDPEAESYENLESAVQGAHEYFTRKERLLR